MNSNFYFYSGLLSGFYALYATFKYYSLSGKNLIHCNDAKKMIKNDKIKYIIDVRTKAEWNIGHYSHAIHVPITSLSKKILNEIISNKNKGILVYCNTGQRARRAAEIIESYGYSKVYYIEGHYSCLHYSL